MKTKKTQFKRGALNKIKNHKAAWFTGTLAAAGIAVFIFAKSCGGPVAEGPMPITPVRGDRICEQVEAYPYQLNSDGTVQRDSENQPVNNPYYSKEDCHRGDNICDNNAEAVRDPEGNTVTLMAAFVDGTAIPSPLENDDSPDCVMQRVRDNPCAEIAEDRSNVISRDTRERVTEDTELGLRQRTRGEVEAMHADVTAVELGDNYFVVENNYSESCDGTLPLCTPESTEACSCPNIQDCVPDHCGNGTVERNQGEQCDTGSAAGRRACRGDTRCTGNCQCVPRRRPTKVNRPPPPQAVCGNGRVDTGEDCDSSASGSSCDPGERCNSSCECEEIPPATSGQCDGNRVPGSGSLISRISSQVTTASGAIKNALNAGGVPVVVTVRVNISASGVPTLGGVSARCGGSTCPQQANVASIAGIDLSGISTSSPSRPCYVLIPVRLR